MGNGNNIVLVWVLCTKSLEITSLFLFVQNTVLSPRELFPSSLMITVLVSLSMILQALGYNSFTFDLKLKKKKKVVFSMLELYPSTHHSHPSKPKTKLSTLGAYVQKYDALI